jgi:hypothetical protein
MPNVLVEGAVLKCSHGGTPTLANGDQRLKISNKWELQALMRVAQRRGLAQK